MSEQENKKDEKNEKTDMDDDKPNEAGVKVGKEIKVEFFEMKNWALSFDLTDKLTFKQFVYNVIGDINKKIGEGKLEDLTPNTMLKQILLYQPCKSNPNEENPSEENLMIDFINKKYFADDTVIFKCKFQRNEKIESSLVQKTLKDIAVKHSMEIIKKDKDIMDWKNKYLAKCEEIDVLKKVLSSYQKEKEEKKSE